jgi:hypothetical protein
MNMIEISSEDLKELKRLYKNTNPGDVFFFKENEILHDYAKYLIEYLELKFSKK